MLREKEKRQRRGFAVVCIGMSTHKDIVEMLYRFTFDD